MRISDWSSDVCSSDLVLLTVAVSVLARHGSAEQRATWLPGIADGSTRLAFAITESDAGTNAHAIRTTAMPIADGWRIDGAKTYITNVDEAAALIVVARSGTAAATGRGRLTMLLVPADAPGLHFTRIETSVVSHERQLDRK